MNVAAVPSHAASPALTQQIATSRTGRPHHHNRKSEGGPSSTPTSPPQATTTNAAATGSVKSVNKVV